MSVKESIDNAFIGAKEPRLVEDFFEESDRKFAMKFTDFLEGRGVMWGENNLRAYNCDYNEAVYFAKKYASKVFEEYQITTGLYVHCLGFIKYYPGAWMEVHNDKMDEECSDCALSSVMYVNDEYTGGEIAFPKLRKEYHPKAGTCVSYPALWQDFDHGVNKVESGTRYALAWCFTTNIDKAFKPYLPN
jgi:hypothetical protein